MKLIALASLALALPIAPPSPVTVTAAKLVVVATTPDFAAIAREIGGDAVDVKALAKPTEDPHFVDAKPSHIVTLTRADVLIEGGAELELGWLPPLLESARNERIATGGRGRIVASQGLKLAEIPTTFDRSKGDVHSRGNPHFLLDPENAKLVAVQIAERFAQLAPASAATFAANRKRFVETVDAKLDAWQNALAPYKGAAIVTYHKDFVYLASRFNLEVVETLEPKPGIAPSPAHIARVIGTIKARQVKVILVQPYQNRKTAETVARQAGAKVLDVPQQPGAAKNTDTYVALMDNIVNTIVGGLGGAR
jgi:zinc/manganese transport system substrate-binding protein